MQEEVGSVIPSGLGTSMGGKEERMEVLSGFRWGVQRVKERLKSEGHLSAIEWEVRAFQKAPRKGLWLRHLGAVPEETQRGRA